MLNSANYTGIARSKSNLAVNKPQLDQLSPGTLIVDSVTSSHLASNPIKRYLQDLSVQVDDYNQGALSLDDPGTVLIA